MIDNQPYIPIVYCAWDFNRVPEEFFAISIYVKSDLDDHRYGILTNFEYQDEELRQEMFEIGRFDKEHRLDGFGLSFSDEMGSIRIEQGKFKSGCLQNGVFCNPIYTSDTTNNEEYEYWLDDLGSSLYLRNNDLRFTVSRRQEDKTQMICLK